MIAEPLGPIFGSAESDRHRARSRVWRWISASARDGASSDTITDSASRRSRCMIRRRTEATRWNVGHAQMTALRHGAPPEPATGVDDAERCESSASPVPADSRGGSNSGVIPGLIPGCMRCTIGPMPSPARPRDSSRESVPRRAPSASGRVAPCVTTTASLTVELPSSPPVLTPGAARVLVRVLLKASRERSDRTVPHEGETEVLAS